MRSLLPAPAWVHTFVEESLTAAHAESVPPLAGCPRCHQPLDLCGYRRTETPYGSEEILACAHCGAQLLLSREERA